MDNSENLPRHILITGASSGIGAAMARHYADKGAYLYLSGRDAARLDKIRQSCLDAGAQAVECRVVDVSDKAAMAAWIEGIEAENALDLVIANAGISGGTGGNKDGESLNQVEAVFDVNWSGVLNTVYPALSHMQRRGYGQIALMSSLAGFRGWPGAPAYCASKAAVKVYGEGLRGAVKGSGIKINVICPGFVKSAMTDQNDFPMPFMIGAERAASIIAKGLARNRGRIAFPFPTAIFIWLISSLPNAISEFLLRDTPAKKEKI